MAMILVGTLYPLLADVLGWGKISVGPPYFDFFFVPTMSALTLCVGLAMFTRWKKTELSILRHKANMPMLLSLLLALVLPLFMSAEGSGSDYSWAAVITLLLGFWVISISVADVATKLAGKVSRVTLLPGSYWGMICAHLGLAVCVLGVGLSSIYDVQKDVRMEPGDKAMVSGYEFEFVGVKQVQGPNYTAFQGQIKVQSEYNFSALLTPEKRNYSAGGQVMTEAAIDASLSRDLYVSLAEPLAGQAWAIRLQVKPFVRCIWLGGLMIALGGLLAALDKRYRRKRRPASSQHTATVGASL